MGVNVHDPRFGSGFWDIKPIAWTPKEQRNKLDFIKIFFKKTTIIDSWALSRKRKDNSENSWKHSQIIYLKIVYNAEYI